MNGSSSNGMHYSSYSMPPHFTQYQHHTPLSIDPSYVQSQYYTQHQQQPQHQHQQQHLLHQAQATGQTTLSPEALQSPTGLHPSSFYISPAGLQQLAPQIQVNKDQFYSSVRPLLQAAAFTGAQAVSNLVELISNFGSQEVDTPFRLEILTKLRDQAPNHYFRAWSENTTAMDVTREWLKAAVTAKTDDPLVDTIMPLLHVSLNSTSVIHSPDKLLIDHRPATTHGGLA
jgi:protein phosphatase 1 regulatory subunit 10